MRLRVQNAAIGSLTARSSRGPSVAGEPSWREAAAGSLESFPFSLASGRNGQMGIRMTDWRPPSSGPHSGDVQEHVCLQFFLIEPVLHEIADADDPVQRLAIDHRDMTDLV